jgi:hypothetical protein
VTPRHLGYAGARFEAFRDDPRLCLRAPASPTTRAGDDFNAAQCVAAPINRRATTLIVDLTPIRSHHNPALFANATRTIILDHAREMQVAGS